MKKAFLTICSVISWFFLLLVYFVPVPFAFMVWVITNKFDKRLFWLQRFRGLWGFLFVFCNPMWRLKVVGRNNFSDHKPYVLVSNHQSMVDIPILCCLFRHYKWVSKFENMNIPIVGWFMKLNKDLLIKRSSLRSVRHLSENAAQCIAEGNSLMIFPEGTRSGSGKMRPFKEGAFHIALENKVDIVPIVLNNSYNALYPNSWIFRFTRLSLKVLNPIPYESFAHKTAIELACEVQQQIQLELDKMQNQNS